MTPEPGALHVPSLAGDDADDGVAQIFQVCDDGRNVQVGEFPLLETVQFM